jgi:menaquinone-dependent protoporphyrinogen oxidase
MTTGATQAHTEIAMPVLVTYASKHGSTREIAERIAGRLRQRGTDARVMGVAEVFESPGRYAAVVIGSAVYYGRWLGEAVEFVRRHREVMARQPVWMFSSGPVGDQVGVEPVEIAELRAAVGPRDHRLFGGSIDTSKLGLAQRLIARAVHAADGDYRDWDEIEAWADGIFAATGIEVCSRLPEALQVTVGG